MDWQDVATCSQMPRSITFWVPSNRTDRAGKATHVDGWNEFIHAANKGRMVGARLEAENVRNVERYARWAMARLEFAPIEGRALVVATFVEANQRRDVSNVYGGLKWLLDGLTRPRGSKRRGAGLIVDDSPRWCECEPHVEVDPTAPGVRVTVIELEDAQ